MWSGLRSVIQDLSDHAASKEPMNPLWSWIHRFLWCATDPDPDYPIRTHPPPPPLPSSKIPMARTNELDKPPKRTENARYRQHRVGWLWRRALRHGAVPSYIEFEPSGFKLNIKWLRMCTKIIRRAFLSPLKETITARTQMNPKKIYSPSFEFCGHPIYLNVCYFFQIGREKLSGLPRRLL